MKSTRAMALIRTIKDLSEELLELVDTAPSIISESDRYLQDIDHILVIEKGKLTKQQYMALVLERENVLSLRADTKRVNRLKSVVKDTQLFPTLQNLEIVMEHAESVCNKDNQTYTVRSETGLKLLQDIHVGKDLTKDKRYNLNIEVPLGQISSKSRSNRRRNGTEPITKATVKKSKRMLAEVMYGYNEDLNVEPNVTITNESKPLTDVENSLNGTLSIKEYLEQMTNTNQVEELDKVVISPDDEVKTSGSDLQGKISIQEYLDHRTNLKKVEKEVLEETKDEELLKEPTAEEMVEFIERPITTQHATTESFSKLVERLTDMKGQVDNPVYTVNELKSVSEILSVNKVRYLVYAYTKTETDNEFNSWVLDNDEDFTIYRAYAPIVEKLNSMDFYLTQEDLKGKPFAVYLEDDGTNVEIVDVALSVEDLNYIRDTHLNIQLSIPRHLSYS